MKLIIFCPGKEVGGTNTLFARIAENWEKISGNVPTVIDFKDGVMTSYLRKKNVTFYLREHTKGLCHHISNDEVLLMTVLAGRNLDYKIFPGPNSKVFFWITHPEDPFKWVPTFQFFRYLRPKFRYRLACKLHPTYYRKLKHVFRLAAENNGLVAMDSDCKRVLSTAFGQGCDANILPVFTSFGENQYVPGEGLVNVCWVGRLSSHKTWPLINLARDLDTINLKGRQFSLTIVGSGRDEQKIRRELSRLNNITCNFVGTIPAADLDKFLLNRIDLFCGHGISMLEAAKLGIPCLVTDAHFLNMPAMESKYRWFHHLDVGDVGSLVYSEEDFKGDRLDVLISEQPIKWHDLSNRVYEKWQISHSPSIVVKRFYDELSKNSLHYSKIIATDFHKFDLLGKLFIGLKRFHTNKKY